MADYYSFLVPRSWFFLLAAGLCLLPAVQADPPADLPDPVPLKRVLLTPDQLPREMDRARQGVLAKLPRDEFEELVRQAALAESARKNPPRLVEAHYHAELVDGGLVGSCQWKIVHTAAAPGLLPLTPLNLALRQPRFENGDALIADFDGHDPSLLVETAGDHSASAGWSARAEARPEGLQFDLKFPAAPAAVLELDLPADRVPVVDGGGLAGPYAAGAANLKRWTVACGGRSEVALLLRSIDQAPVLRASVQTTQTLSPEGVDATYTFAVKALHQGVRELEFECDADLRPFEVVAPGLEKWQLVAAGPDDPTVQLMVRLAEPLEEGTIQIRCLAPLGSAPGGGPLPWTSPGVRLRQSVPGGETLVLKVHPELRLAAVQSGAFRLKETATETDTERRTDFQRLTFLGGGVTEAGAPTGVAGRRPRAELYPHGVEFRARQLAWWRVDPTRSSLTLQTTYDVSQGRLFQLATRLPAEWEVDRVDLAPAGQLRDWGIRQEKGGPVLVVDLQRPLTPAEKPGARGPTLTVVLEPARHGAVLGKELPFPDAAPLGARFREGALAVGFDEQTHRLEVKTAAREAAPEEEGPWSKETPSFYYPYREPGPDGRALSGTLTLRARPPQVRAQCTNDVILSGGTAVVNTRLVLEAEQGSPESVDLYVSAPYLPTPSGDPWNWRPEQGGVEVQVHRMPCLEAAVFGELGAGDAFSAAATLAARPGSECWRLTFARPLRVHEPIVLHATQAPKTADDRLDIPLTAVLGASRLEGETTLHLAAADPLRVEAFGLREASPVSATRPRGASAWRTFRYNTAAVGLTLRGRVQDADRVAEAAVDYAALTTYVSPDGVLEHHYVFQVSHWLQNTLALQMPAGARLLAFQVDGVWSPRPAFSESAEGRPVIDLPAPRRTPEEDNPAPHRYVVVYTTTAPVGWLWTRFEAPAPAPPVTPAVFERLWRLAPEFSPLDDGWGGTARLRRRPGPGEGTPAADAAFRPEDLFRAAPSPPLLWSRVQGRGDADRGAALSDALLSLRENTEQTRSLGAVVEETAAALQRTSRGGVAPPFDKGGVAPPLSKDAAALPQSKGGVVPFQSRAEAAPSLLVVDGAALREAGIGPATLVALKRRSESDETPPWESLGLTTAPVASGWLLTTRRQLQEWRETAGASAPAAVDSAAGAAARWGRDASGRFLAAPVWRHSANEVDIFLLSPQTALGHWSEWAPLPGAGAGDAVVVVRRPLFDAAGWTLTLLLGPLFLAARWRRARFWLLLLWLALSGVGLLWLPVALQGLAWPALLGGCACALVWRLWSAFRRPAPRFPSKTRTAVAAASAALLLFLLSGWGRPADSSAPLPVTVYVAPGPIDAPDKQLVLAPPDLLNQLRTLARPAAGPGAVLLNAEYNGKILEGTAEFDAVFQAYCFTDETTTLALPLDGVQLTGDVLLDGAVVQAAPLPAPQTGFTIPIKGRPGSGDPPHKIELRFRTAVIGTAEERNVQFTAPRLAQSRLTLDVPKGSAYLQALVKYGVQNTAEVGDAVRLDVDLGRVSVPLHIRWVPESRSDATAPPHPPQPEVQLKEAYLWDLRVDSSALTAFLAYTLPPSGTASLAVKIPAELEVLAVEARRPRDGAPVRLRDWKVVGTGAGRALQMEFSSPVNGDVEALLELAPRSPLPPSFLLPLPSPLLPPSPATGKPTRSKVSYLAYRTEGLEVERVNSVGVTGVRPDEFAPFWPVSSRPGPDLPVYASTLLREDESHPPVLGLKVHPSPPATHARIDVEVSVGPRQADVRATAVLTAPEGDLSLVQWEAPSPQPFTVTGVAGPNVRRWNQEGDRVLVWLEPAVKGETKLEMTGWLPLSGSGGGVRLELPCLRLTSAESQETTVHLTPGDELALTEAGLRNLTALDPKHPEKGLAYTAGNRTDYGGAWQVHTGPAEVRIYTAAGMRDRRLAFVAVVDCQPAHGDVQALTVRVRNWSGDVRLEAPPAVRLRERRHGPDDRVWTLDRDPGVPGRLRVTLFGDQAAETTGAVMPDVTVAESAHVDRWAASAPDLTPEAALGLTPMEDPAGALAALDPSDAVEQLRAGGPVWKITSPEWRLNLSPRDAAAPAAAIEVFLAEYRAAAAGGRWMHEAVYWLRHEANTDLNLTLPADAEVLSVAIDDAETAPLQAEPKRLWLPLTGRPPVCRVRVRWRYTTEELAHPNLERPTLPGAREGPAVWTVSAPPGWEADALGGKTVLQPGLAQAAALSWQRAEAQYRISESLAQQAPEGGAALAEAQRRFYAECQRARQTLEASPAETTSAWPAGRSPMESIQVLLKENKELSEKRHVEEERARAEKQAEAGDAGREETRPWDAEGRPLYARFDAPTPAPKLTLTPVEVRHEQEAWTATWAWLSFLGLIGVLSLSPSVAARMRSFWPEQIGLVGLVGWWAAGPTAVTLALLLLGVCGRALILFQAIGWLFRRPKAAKSVSAAAAMPAALESGA